MLQKRWHRIGLVASIMWTIYSCITQIETQYEQGNKIVQSLHAACINEKPYDECMEQYLKDLDVYTRPYWSDIIFFTLVPLVGAWLLVFISYFTYRWVMRGR